MTALTRGARATVLRGGADIVAAVNIPAEGAFVLRSLPPGQYTIRDTCGGERAFRVNATDEVVTLLEGGDVGQSGEPGSTGVQDVDALHVGPSPAIRVPEQVAPERSVSGPLGPTQHTTPDNAVNVPRGGKLPDRSPARGVNVEDDERVPGAAGAALVHGEGDPARVVRTTEADPPASSTALEAGGPAPGRDEPEPEPERKPAAKKPAARKPAAKKPAAKKAAK